jgi:hypothetical protein
MLLLLRARARVIALHTLTPYAQLQRSSLLSTNAAPAAADGTVDEKTKLWNDHLVDLFTRQQVFTFPDSVAPTLFEKVSCAQF